MNPAVDSAEMVDQFPAAYMIDPDDADTAALNWLEHQMQMSIDPTDTLAGVLPDDKCLEKPWECPYKTNVNGLQSAGHGAWSHRVEQDHAQSARRFFPI